jgi:hypothetical protein
MRRRNLHATRNLLSSAAALGLFAAGAVPAQAARQATDDERAAIYAEFGSTPRCTIEPDADQVMVSSVDPIYAATKAAPDCEYEWIVSEFADDQWTAIAYGDIIGSCQVIDDLEVARDLRVCASGKTCRAARAPRGTGQALKRAAPARPRSVLKVRYGVCGAERWALATFSFPRVGVTNQPTLLRKQGGRWRNMGEIGNGAPCEASYGYEGAGGPLPFEMLDAWRIDATPCLNAP